MNVNKIDTEIARWESELNEANAAREEAKARLKDALPTGVIPKTGTRYRRTAVVEAYAEEEWDAFVEAGRRQGKAIRVLEELRYERSPEGRAERILARERARRIKADQGGAGISTWGPGVALAIALLSLTILVCLIGG